MVVLSSGARLAKDSNREGAFRFRKGTHCLGAIEFASSLSHNRPSSALQATFGNRGRGGAETGRLSETCRIKGENAMPAANKFVLKGPGVEVDYTIGRKLRYSRLPIWLA